MDSSGKRSEFEIKLAENLNGCNHKFIRLPGLLIKCVRCGMTAKLIGFLKVVNDNE